MLTKLKVYKNLGKNIKKMLIEKQSFIIFSIQIFQRDQFYVPWFS
jgi:hypothetical protein